MLSLRILMIIAHIHNIINGYIRKHIVMIRIVVVLINRLSTFSIIRTIILITINVITRRIVVILLNIIRMSILIVVIRARIHDHIILLNPKQITLAITMIRILIIISILNINIMSVLIDIGTHAITSIEMVQCHYGSYSYQ